MAHNRQVALLFHEAGDATKDSIGGKAASLVAMTRLNMPVPPGFVIGTTACRAYLEHARYPRRLEWQIRRCMNALEQKTGKRFGDSSNPLLVSVRSGAPVSMPGMMDTILNLGMTPDMIPAFSRVGGELFARDTYSRFCAGFKKVVGSETNDPQEQLGLAFEAISQSWLNDRARAYRRAHGIPEDVGTAVIVQAMVYGNLNHDSGTGVFFSRNVATGANEPYGEFLPCAQGEDVVGGNITPLPIAEFAQRNPRLARELLGYASILERRKNDIVEIEFTVESGRLWTLQYRVAKRASVAAARFAVQLAWEKRITRAEAVERVSDADVGRLKRLEFNPEALATLAPHDAWLFARGLPASPGAATGIAVFSSDEAQELARRGKSVVLFRPETNPDDFAGMLVSSAIVTERGGATSHAAVVARGLGKPAVVGTGVRAHGIAALMFNANDTDTHGRIVSVDGAAGLVVAGIVPMAEGVRHKETSIFLRWFAELRHHHRGRADFSAVDQEYSANTILNTFYLSDAMASAAAGTELEKEANEVREREHREAAEIFSAYLIVAVAGELRHGFGRINAAEHADGVKALDEIAQRFGVLDPERGECDRFDAQMSVVRRLADAGRDAWIDFLSLAVSAFPTFQGAEFGGLSWATIAETACAYIRGELADTVFVDRVFDLRHNGGHLFDKHQMFTRKTDEYTLQLQLNQKKIARSLNDLVVRLAAISAASDSDADGVIHGKGRAVRMPFAKGVSPAVKALWRRGEGVYWDKAPEPS